MAEDKRQQLTVWDYGQIIFRRKWFFIIPTVIVFLTAVIGTRFLPKIYRSSTTILVQETGLVNPNLLGDMAVSSTVDSRLVLLETEIKSSKRLKQLIHQIEADQTLTSPDQMNSLINHLRRNISVEMDYHKVTGLTIIIAYEGPEPYTVQEVVKGITDIFMEENLLLQKEESTTTIDFIKEQLENYKQRLEEAEKALQKFQEENLLELPVGTSKEGGAGKESTQIIVSPDLDKLTSTQSSLMEVNLQIQMLEKQKAMLRRQLSGEEKVILDAVTKEVNPVAAKLQERLIGLQAELADARTQFTEEHPEVLRLKMTIERIKDQLAQEEKTIRSGEVTKVNPIYQELERKYREVELAIDSFRTRQGELSGLVARYKERVKDVPKRELEYSRLIRNQATNQKIYNMFFDKLQAADISWDLEGTKRERKFIILEEPQLPTSPIKPKKEAIALLGLFIGMGLGLGCVFLTEYTDHSFRSVEDAQVFLGLPALGSTALIITETEEARQQLYSRIIWAVLGVILVAVLAAGSIQYYREHIRNQETPMSAIIQKGGKVWGR
ncbi:MAG: XrtA system polysaccharide chain length determinant [bacterium]